MIRRSILTVSLLTTILVANATVAAAEPIDPTTSRPGSVAEARARARILHEAFHGALQVVHRDFFDEDDARVLPSGSLEDVFTELEKQFDIKIRWLAVNAKAMNIDHEASDDFEKDAVQALQSGKKEYERVSDDRYLHVGTIRLASQCLKCHLPRRTSTADRSAALSISMPLKPAAPAKPASRAE
jgi:hypothetical protein